MTKQDKIKEVWGENYDKVKGHIDEDGFLDWAFRGKYGDKNPASIGEMYTLCGGQSNTYIRHVGPKPHSRSLFAPKTLKGMQNNNGWETIPSNQDKEIEKGQYWVVYPNGFIEVAYYEGTMDCYKFWKLNFTHYQPITKPEPPIY